MALRAIKTSLLSHFIINKIIIYILLLYFILYFEKEHSSLEWLRCDEDDEEKSLVSVLWCVVCHKYKMKIVGHKNVSRAWIDGSTNHKTSNITDHARSDQHKSAMMHFHKDQAKSRNEPVTTYSPIARSILSSTSMDPTVRERVKKSSISALSLPRSIFHF